MEQRLDALEERVAHEESVLDGTAGVAVDNVDELIAVNSKIEKTQAKVEALLSQVPVPTYVKIGRLRVEDAALRLGGIDDETAAGFGLSPEAWDAADSGKENWTIRMAQGTVATIVLTTDDGRTTKPYTAVIEGTDVRQPLRPLMVDNNEVVVTFNEVGEFRIYVEESGGNIPEGLIIVEPFKF
ncbi:hypothetical protein ACFLVJ_02035 [Chloroflexota bacterium]